MHIKQPSEFSVFKKIFYDHIILPRLSQNEQLIGLFKVNRLSLIVLLFVVIPLLLILLTVAIFLTDETIPSRSWKLILLFFGSIILINRHIRLALELTGSGWIAVSDQGLHFFKQRLSHHAYSKSLLAFFSIENWLKKHIYAHEFIPYNKLLKISVKKRYIFFVRCFTVTLITKDKHKVVYYSLYKYRRRYSDCDHPDRQTRDYLLQKQHESSHSGHQ